MSRYDMAPNKQDCIDIGEFWETLGVYCEHAHINEMYNIVICEHDKKRRIMCCDGVCPRPRWTQEMIDEMKRKGEKLYNAMVKEKMDEQD